MVEEIMLSQMGFAKQGELLCPDIGDLVFQGAPLSIKSSPGIYLWLSRINATSHDVKYVGKAGNGLAARMKQHVAGLKKASLERVDQIKESSGDGKCLEVWFRESAVWGFEKIFCEIPGSTCHVSAYSLEEEALITHFVPPLNRATTPAMRAKVGTPQATLEGFAALDFEMTDANGEQRDLWTDAVRSLEESHTEKISEILELVLNFLKRLDVLKIQWPLDYRVIGEYSSHPIPKQPLLVLGKFVTKRFSRGSTVVYISLENELISFSDEITKMMPEKPDQGGAYSLDACIAMLLPRKI